MVKNCDRREQQVKCLLALTAPESQDRTVYACKQHEKDQKPVPSNQRCESLAEFYELCVRLHLVCNIVGEPVQSLIQPFTGCGTCALDVPAIIEQTLEKISDYKQSPLQKFVCMLELPMALAERVKAKLVSDLSSIHRIWKILFVSKYQQHGIPQLVLSIFHDIVIDKTPQLTEKIPVGSCL